MQHIALSRKPFSLMSIDFRFALKLLLLSFIIQLFACVPSQRASAQIQVSLDVFYNELNPYGRWVSHPLHGRIWYPSVHADFTPYGTDGYWAYTDAGWTWISDFSWGWAPFHYGRWSFDVSLGWGWIPDTEWGPGWVVWRRAQGFYGWAPIGPGIGIDFAYSSGYNIPGNYWHFIRDQDFGRRDIHHYYIGPENIQGVFHASAPIHNFHNDAIIHSKYNKGPVRNEVERVAGRPLGDIYIRESMKPIQSLENNRLDLYRPHFQNQFNNRKSLPNQKIITPPRINPPKDKMFVPAPKKLQKQNPRYRAIPVTPKTKKEKH